MIVKVQLSEYTTAHKQQMIIYDKVHIAHFEGDVTDEVKRAMGPKFKAFFYATLKHGRVHLHEEAPPQFW